MTATILGAASVVGPVRAATEEQVAALKAMGVTPGLGVILVGDDPASAVYVRAKTRYCEELGLFHETRRLPAATTTAEVESAVREYNSRRDVHGILVQLPLPPQIDTQRVLDLVDAGKDVDGFHPDNVGRLVQKRPRFVPCTPAGIMEMLRRNAIEIAGRRAVVVGRSDIVGKPMALLLLHADATVTLCHSKTMDLAAMTREADILVAAIGRAGLIRREHVKRGAVVVDVGMNRIDSLDEARVLLDSARLVEFERRGHALVGDVHFPEVREVASAVTPVPGGVGPLTIAMLVHNTSRAALAQAALPPGVGTVQD
jgi:methylenetetrahydrofolate dehydrogenase (NADP+) / methenyltetrahydrofolate cyclohydrolase